MIERNGKFSRGHRIKARGMIEVEQKFRLCPETRERLKALGAQRVSIRRVCDVYYDVPSHKMVQNDHWLRRRNGRWELKYHPSGWRKERGRGEGGVERGEEKGEEEEEEEEEKEEKVEEGVVEGEKVGGRGQGKVRDEPEEREEGKKGEEGEERDRGTQNTTQSKIKDTQTTHPLKQATPPHKQATLPHRQDTHPLKLTPHPLKLSTPPHKQATQPHKQATHPHKQDTHITDCDQYTEVVNESEIMSYLNEAFRLPAGVAIDMLVERDTLVAIAEVDCVRETYSLSVRRGGGREEGGKGGEEDGRGRDDGYSGWEERGGEEGGNEGGAKGGEGSGRHREGRKSKKMEEEQERVGRREELKLERWKRSPLIWTRVCGEGTMAWVR